MSNINLTTIKIPHYYGANDNVNNNSVQIQVYDILCRWNAAPGFYVQRNDSARTKTEIIGFKAEVQSFLDSVAASNDVSVASVYSVIDYFFDDNRLSKYPDATRKDRDFCKIIKEVKDFIEKLLKERDSQNKQREDKTLRNKVKETSSSKTSSKTPNKTTSKNVSVLKTDSSISGNDEFPTFAPEGFPNAESNIFQSLLSK